jgi:dUTP pyrophosphatase
MEFKSTKPLFKKHKGDAGYDIASDVDGTIGPMESLLVSTGIHLSIPFGSYGRLCSRSSLAVKNNIEVGAGIIDESYRGEVKVLLRNFGKEPFAFNKNDRIAQLVISPCFIGDVEVVDELDMTERGEGGFGSTGK